MSLLKYHQRNSFFLKIACLIGIVSIIIIVLNLLNFQSIFVTNKETSTKQFQNRPISEKIKNTELTLKNSVFRGVNEDLQPYEITASTANKVSESQFTLNKVGANYLVGNSNLLINAKVGLLDNLENWMELSDDVQIFFNNLLLNTSEIHLNLINKEVFGKKNVKATYKNSQIQADSFNSRNNNDIINFKGNVHTILKLEDF